MRWLPEPLPECRTCSASRKQHLEYQHGRPTQFAHLKLPAFQLSQSLHDLGTFYCSVFLHLLDFLPELFVGGLEFFNASCRWPDAARDNRPVFLVIAF
jgi:hypothetical protein